MEVDWSKIAEAYDAIERDRKLRKSSGSSSAPKYTMIGEDKYPIWTPMIVEYCKRQISGTYIREALYGVSRCSLMNSDDHIAHVVLRMYVRRIIPFPRPFGLQEVLDEEVWGYLKVVAREEHLKAIEDIEFEREAWNRNGSM